MRAGSTRAAFAAVALLALGCAGPRASPFPGPAPARSVPAAEPPPTGESAAAPSPTGVRTAVYTEEQARRGQNAFRRVCSECHYASEFKGPVFTDAWARRTARDLYRELRRTMPDDNPGGLPRQTYVDVMAYLLELNGYPAGSDELPPDDEILSRVRLTPPKGPGPER